MKLAESVVNSFFDYPLSWTYAISLTAFQPYIGEFVPVINQVLLLLLIHLVTIFVDWLRKKLKVPAKEQKDNMDMLRDLDNIIERRKDMKKRDKKDKKGD